VRVRATIDRSALDCRVGLSRPEARFTHQPSAARSRRGGNARSGRPRRARGWECRARARCGRARQRGVGAWNRARARKRQPCARTVRRSRQGRCRPGERRHRAGRRRRADSRRRSAQALVGPEARRRPGLCRGRPRGSTDLAERGTGGDQDCNCSRDRRSLQDLHGFLLVRLLAHRLQFEQQPSAPRSIVARTLSKDGPARTVPVKPSRSVRRVPSASTTFAQPSRDKVAKW
jgi:hypothetical protein